MARYRGRGERLDHAHALVRSRQSRQRPRDAPPSGGAAGVHDPALRVASLQAERQVAVAVGVEPHAELLKVAHPLG